MSTHSDTLRSLFIDGLKNAHAVEKQALSIMEPQVSRIESYPELADQLRVHIDETKQQIERLETTLSQFDTSASSLKDAALSMTGSMGAFMHSFAGDEILKNTFANHAFENFEIAAYRSLITLGEAGGFGDATRLLNQSLTEEQRMADWLLKNTPMITLRYAELSAEGEIAQV